jgi:hypothetical protein
MRHVVVAWAKADDCAFEANVPLVFLGERNRRLGSKISFDVLFLEGLNLLSEEYREKLSELGYYLHDLEGLYLRLKDRYTLLARFGDYEQKCFLRWLAIRDFYGREPFVHYDADIVFNATPEEIETNFAGLTFILQGCPAYARVEDSAWSESYQVELDRFVADIEVYSADAWRKRLSFAATVRERNGSLWERPILSSDQDFMQFLTLSGQLPHADAAAVNGHCSSLLFKNPIECGDEIDLPHPLAYERRDGIDYISGRKVAFWHMQGCFSDYLGYATFLNQFRIGGRIPWVRRLPWVRDSRPLSYLAYRALTRFTDAYSREQLMRRYFGENSDDLSFLLNNKRFWQPGVFEPSKPSKL